MRHELGYHVKKTTLRRKLKRISFWLALALLVFAGGYQYGFKVQVRGGAALNPFVPALLTKAELRDQIKTSNPADLYRFKRNEVQMARYEEPVILDYAFDPAIQSMAEDLLAQYKPDLGVMVAMDASTGRVLAMAGENRVFELDGNPALESTFPSASVFKVVTASAAIEEQKANPHTLIAYAGRNHTLYKYQVLKERVTGWMHHISLKEAFAKSINTVFGRLAVFELGKEPLKNYSSRFAYDEPITAEFPIALSHAANPSTQFELAEMASGYTQDNVMSPIHGAMIAAAVANDGIMMQPYFLNAAYLKSGKTIYRSEPAIQNKVMTAETAKEVRTLMRETVTRGTSRKAFHGFFRGKFSSIDVGGKTGHLTDRNLRGRIDWFVGFAEAHGRKIAVSVLTMHKKFWTVKSSYLARRTFETAFSQKKVAQNEP
jgi:cell division protein FtsI/penicillin-binding protein 2